MRERAATTTACLADAAVDAFVAAVGTPDPGLIEEGRYSVAEEEGAIVGCGGWSLAAPAYARMIAGVAVNGGPAPTVRAMYVEPARAGRGIGGGMLGHVEAAILAAGFRRAVLPASPMGLAFHLRRGCRPLGTVALKLPGGHTIASTEMDKLLAPERRAA
jgi:GNAT superfamily N-acetyltransferase